MSPAPPTPGTWIDTLPPAPPEENLLEGALYIMRATVVGVTSNIVNPVLLYADGALHLAERSGSGNTWHYDAEADELQANGQASNGMVANIREQLGNYTVSNARQVGDITKEMVIARFL